MKCMSLLQVATVQGGKAASEEQPKWTICHLASGWPCHQPRWPRQWAARRAARTAAQGRTSDGSRSHDGAGEAGEDREVDLGHEGRGGHADRLGGPPDRGTRDGVRELEDRTRERLVLHKALLECPEEGAGPAGEQIGSVSTWEYRGEHTCVHKSQDQQHGYEYTQSAWRPGRAESSWQEALPGLSSSRSECAWSRCRSQHAALGAACPVACWRCCAIHADLVAMGHVCEVTARTNGIT